MLLSCRHSLVLLHPKAGEAALLFQRSPAQVNELSCLLPYSSGIQRNVKCGADIWYSKHLQEGCSKRRKSIREDCVKAGCQSYEPFLGEHTQDYSWKISLM